MAKFNVFFTVHATAMVTVEAASEDDAKRLAAEEYADTPISICHQCSSEISDPAYGEAVDACEVAHDQP